MDFRKIYLIKKKHWCIVYSIFVLSHRDIVSKVPYELSELFEDHLSYGWKEFFDWFILRKLFTVIRMTSTFKCTLSP